MTLDAASLRGWAALVTAVAGLATAVWKPQSHDVEKASYAELSKAVDKLSSQVQQNHDDVAALRGYIAAKDGEGLITRAPMTLVEPLPSADAGAPAHRGSSGVGHKPAGESWLGSGAGAGLGSGAGGSVKFAAPAAAAPPVSATSVPEVHAAPAPVHPADFDSVLRGKL